MFVILVLAGCSSPGQDALPAARATELLPTWVAETIQARRNPFLTVEVTPSPPVTEPSIEETIIEPSVTPSITVQITSISEPSTTPGVTNTPAVRLTRTPTVTPTLAIPDAAIQVVEPGPLSRIISPLHVRAWVKPGGDGKVRIELLGEDGRLLVRKILRYGEGSRRFFLDEILEFEIPGVAETGRLQISTHDSYDRLASQSAQDLILLSIGDTEVNPPGELTELVIIQEPLPNKLIQGGTLLISGLARTFNNQDLLVELIARDGQVVGYRQAFVPQGTQGMYTPFTVEVPFKVDAVTNVRLTVKGFSNGRIKGIMYVTSEEILLSP